MKFLITFLGLVAFSLMIEAQVGLDITAKGQFNSTWLFNKNISDQGADHRLPIERKAEA